MIEQDFLFEIGTEELPPKSLLTLAKSLKSEIAKGLKDAALSYSSISFFATPRRLAIKVDNLISKQADADIKKFGPAIASAFDSDGNPTKAAEGFARSCGVSVAELKQADDGKAVKLLFSSTLSGSSTESLLPDIISNALQKLPISKRMRWGSSRVEFVRPVHWCILLFGSTHIPATFLGVRTDNFTCGHRFLYPQQIVINSVSEYQELLYSTGFVIASFDQRKSLIKELIQNQGNILNAKPVIDESLLNEVTALVEWPVALTGSFDPAFLSVPQEALISSMKDHQKYFHFVDGDNQILPNFITISNLISKDPQQVISGNEKVIGPRLKDAAFFFEQDKKISLFSLREKLKTVIFQKDLGTVYDKSTRVSQLSVYISGILDYDTDSSKRAALLAKSDLLTNMVGEFSDLQGIMGYYYALNDNELPEVALAIKEQYLPRFSGDDLPSSSIGIVLALAERIDTLVGLFAIGQPPTGSKDPFALRRSALGILRILIQNKIQCNLLDIIKHSISTYSSELQKDDLSTEVMNFIYDRLKAMYTDQNIHSNIFLSVFSLQPSSPYDFDLRITAVNHFISLPQAVDLSAANKRVTNILSKSEDKLIIPINTELFSDNSEVELNNKISELALLVDPLISNHEYTQALTHMASLQSAINNFFDSVMVNSEDTSIRNNRISLLFKLRQLFLKIADITHLSS